jgi:squalene monooxygenase
MTVGFLDIVLLTKLLHPSSIPSFHDTDGVLAAMDRFHRTRKNHCTVINVLAQALYALFSAGDSKELGILREACFAYFHLGGICVEHPIGLLSG